MAGSWRHWVALDWPSRCRLIGAGLGLLLIAFALRLSGYVETRRWLERHSLRSARRIATSADMQAAQSLARLASIAGRRGVVKVPCLGQSLLVYWWLRRRGLEPDLKIGVHRRSTAIDAHAWVELDGKPMGQPTTSHQAFSTYPTA